MSKKFNFIDLFCGAGGLSTGLKMAGFEEVFACDFDESSVETMRVNHKETQVIHSPVQKLTKKKIEDLVQGRKIHLVAGGPPCQGFSTIGKGDPEDERNSLFKDFVRIVRYLDPEFVLFENVTGMLSKKNESTFQKIVSSFRRIGYDLHVQILEAQKFGVPQKRRRTFLVGTRRGGSFSFPKPCFDTDKVPARNLGDILKEIKSFHRRFKSDPNHDLENCNIRKSIDKKRLECIPEGGCIRYQKDEEFYLPKKLRLGVEWGTIRENRLRENHYHRLSRKKPVPTLNTHNHHYFHPVEVRKFTLREFAAMQSFPLDYIFKGSRTSIVRQIGNAVPPLLAKEMGVQIRKFLMKSSRKQKSTSRHSSLASSIQDIRSKAFVY